MLKASQESLSDIIYYFQLELRRIFFFFFSFFFFFCRFLKNSPSRFIKVLKKVLMEIGFLYVSTDK